MSDNNFIKNITSKDLNLSRNTILNLIKSKDSLEFELLCSKSDFIFPFLKERITDDFIKLIEKEDIETVFEFSKIYCPDFEDIVVKSWLKFANEDLTDEILEIFENGTNEQKIYASVYFRHIKDPLALELLNKYAKSNNFDLKINCAQTLRAFNDKTIYNEMKEIVKTSNDDFIKLEAFEYICAFKGDDTVDFVLKNSLNSPFKINIISNLLDFNDIKNVEKEKLESIFNVLIEGYPEDISLDTVCYYNILDLCKKMYEFKDYNPLIFAKIKFNEFNNNDIYLFDLDNNSKNELKNICNYLNGLNLEFEYKDDEVSFEIVKELKLENYCLNIANSVNSKKLQETLIAKAVLVLKELNQINLIDKTIINSIENENIRMLVEACVK